MIFTDMIDKMIAGINESDKNRTIITNILMINYALRIVNDKPGRIGLKRVENPVSGDPNKPRKLKDKNMAGRISMGESIQMRVYPQKKD